MRKIGLFGIFMTLALSRMVLPGHEYPNNGPIGVQKMGNDEPLTVRMVKEFQPQIVYSGFSIFDDYHQSGMYFNFYEALNKSQNGTSGDSDIPIILWLQGGPGCSSWLGNLVEFGPYDIKESSSPDDEQTTGIRFGSKFELIPRIGNWNEKYHLLFIDNPFGSGYSYASTEEDYVSNEEQVGYLVSTTTQRFMEKFPEYNSNPVFIFGESYGGHYVPAVGEYILKNSLPLNLKGLAIGDGWTDPINQIGTFSLFSVANGLVDFKQAGIMRGMEQKAREFVYQKDSKSAIKSFQDILAYVCDAAGGIRDINYREFGSCNEIPADLTSEFLNDLATKEIFGIPDAVKYSECNTAPFNYLQDDYIKSQKSSVEYCLQHIPVLLYNGQNDLGINLVSSEKWIRSMDWEHIDGYLAANKTSFETPDGKIAGYIRNFNNLFQAIVLDAGHEVPKDQLERSVALLDTYFDQLK